MLLIEPALTKFPFKETNQIEFKRTYSDSIALVVSAFLNTDGGTIVIGVDEQKGIVGVSDARSKVVKMQRLLETVIEPFDNSLVEISIFAAIVKLELIIVKVKKSQQLHSTRFHGTKKFYFRQGNRNISFLEKDAEIHSLSNYGLKMIVTDTIGDYTHYKIGNYAKGSYFFKYMSLETALLCIRNSTIRFAEPLSWADKYESRFYNATINGKKQSSNNPPLAACCFTYRQDNEAAWKIYSYDQKGLNSRCVEFKIDRDKLRRQLLSALFGNDDFKGKFQLYEGVVSYKDEQFINNLHRQKIRQDKKCIANKSFDAFFKIFSIEKYLSLMLLKRNAFLHEQEVRFFLVPEHEDDFEKGKLPCVDIPVNWAEILQGVRIDGNCTEFEQELFKEELLKKGNLGTSLSGIQRTLLNPEPYNVYEQKIKRPLLIK